MPSVATYLYFDGNSEEVFNFYAKVFGTEIEGDIMRYKDVPEGEGMPLLSEENKEKIMNISLPILAGHKLMATDMVEGMGEPVRKGNNFSISLHPDTNEEADRLYNALSENGKRVTEMQDMFWGDYYGDLVDQYGISWVINVINNQ